MVIIRNSSFGLFVSTAGFLVTCWFICGSSAPQYLQSSWISTYIAKVQRQYGWILVSLQYCVSMMAVLKCKNFLYFLCLQVNKYELIHTKFRYNYCVRNWNMRPWFQFQNSVLVPARRGWSGGRRIPVSQHSLVYRNLIWRLNKKTYLASGM